MIVWNHKGYITSFHIYCFFIPLRSLLGDDKASEGEPLLLNTSNSE